jgi:hypothetical protein
MRLNVKGFLFISLLIGSCNYVTYTPKTKKQSFHEKPSPLIFDRIVDFRIEQMGWPISKSDFMSKGKKYYEVFEDFPYLVADFKVIDSNRMTFYFSSHIADMERYNRTGKVDLNSYGGKVRFYKENDKFIWKIKMN